jgi:CubicO group peptidase (beta-lactamase class C family)
MRFRAALFSLLSCVSFSTALIAQTSLPTIAPEDAGFSSERLQRLDAVARRLVDERAIAGAVVLLARHGGIAHFEAYGQMDVEARIPMRRDALFRICSMSKPITSVAALVLFEEGRFLLDDPVAKFLPEFANPQVLVAGSAAAPAFEPAAHPITIRHLLTHTSGIAYRFMAPPAIAELYAKAGITDGLSETDLDLAENVRRIAAQPLVHQPGTRWTYGLNTDVLGRLVEAVSKKPLGDFLEERIFGPLGMVDTGFFVPSEKQERLAKVYRTDRGPGMIEALADGITRVDQLVFSPSYPYAGPRRNQSGGGGLVSTAMDYARFSEMLLESGSGEGAGSRLLGRKTVEMMASNHSASLETKAELRFGLGLAIAADPGSSGSIVSEGTWGWDGFYTTRFWIDPSEEMIGLVLTQTYPYGGGGVLDRLQAMAYQAIED